MTPMTLERAVEVAIECCGWIGGKPPDEAAATLRAWLPQHAEALARLKALEERIEARAAKIKAAHAAPDSYYRVAGDEPVDYMLDDELWPIVQEIAAVRKALGVGREVA